MKPLTLIALSVLACISLPACGGDSNHYIPNQQAVDRGIRDAEAAMSLPAGSMQREDAILAIRAKEYRLRQGGYENAANDYAAAADSIITAHSHPANP